jgi:hypothetical protein
MTGIIQITGWLRILTRRRVQKYPVLVDQCPDYANGVVPIPT